MLETILSYSMTPVMFLEILFAQLLFARKFPRRNYFPVRLVASIVASVYITVWIELIYSFVTGQDFNYNTSGELGSILFKIFYYIAIFMMSVFCLYISFDHGFRIALITAALGYAMQFFASNLCQLLHFLYAGLAEPYETLLSLVLGLVCCGAVYTLFYLFGLKKYSDWDRSEQNYSNILLFIVIVLMCIFLSRMSIDDAEKSLLASIVEPIAFMMASMLLIMMQFALCNHEKMAKELSAMKFMLQKEREQFALSKENIEIINEKCHDLKHQISLLRENSSEKKIEEIEKAVMIYDSTIKTGNDVLDILLSEKKLQCESKGIKFTSVVRGDLLSFVDDMDLYSLFGNAISNAMESVAQIPSLEKRHISLKVRQVGSLVSIHVENYYEGEIHFEDGLPLTSKDKTYHGFGMKSMQRIVASYQGSLSVTAEDGLFKLDILLPVKS